MAEPSTPKKSTSALPSFLTPTRRTDKKPFADVAIPTSPSFAFAKAKRGTPGNSFQTPDPGRYNVPPEPHESPSFSFGKAARQPLDLTSYSQGAIYDIVQKTASDAIAHAIPKQSRFATKNSKSPGPGEHFINDEQTRDSPARYSFGQRVSEKLFYSKLLNKAQTVTPGAIYEIDEAEELVYEHAPEYKIGTSKRGKITLAESPGPAEYSPNKGNVLNTEPKATFGLESRENTKFFSDELSNTRGTASPGPYLYPSVDFYSTSKSLPHYSFPKDERDHIDRHRSTVGPGQYSPSNSNLSRSYSLGGKEHEAKHALAFGSRKIRFLSKELNADTLGFESPGAKYKVKEFIGTEALKKSVPKAGKDVEFDATEKLYLGFSHCQASSLLARESPGPIYNVRDIPKAASPIKYKSPSRIVKRTVERKQFVSPGPGAYDAGTGYDLNSKYKNSKTGTSFGKPTANSRQSFTLPSPSPGPAYTPTVETFSSMGAGFGTMV